MASLEVFMYSNTSANNDSFYFFLSNLNSFYLFFSCLIDMATTSNTTLSKNSFSFLPLGMMLVVSLPYVAFIM